MRVVKQMSSKLTQTIIDWLNQFDEALCCRDLVRIMKLFNEDCYWRDLITFTWNIKTMEGKNEIAAMLRAVLPHVNPRKWKISGVAAEENHVINGTFTFETSDMTGEGYLRLIDGKCWTLLTSSTGLKKYEERKIEAKELCLHSWKQTSKTANREFQIPVDSKDLKQPYCIIIGGGQSGIALGARLKQLNVPAIILEKNPRPGDSWRNRYDALWLHDPVWTHHLPYVEFPKDWPVFPHKDQLGDWLEAYTDLMGLDYWTSSECIKASYDMNKQTWSVLVSRNGPQLTLHPKQLVFATGMSGFPYTPKLSGADIFKGHQSHSTLYKSAKAYSQKKCVVLGSNTSAHDICLDLYKHGADVTMIQPSSSTVIPLKTLMEDFFKNYPALGMTTHQGDLLAASIPYKVKTSQQISLFKKIKEKDSTFFESLTKAGFLLDFGEDESGISMKYHRRGSGYYFDVGASDLIIEGKIKLKSGVNILEIKENSVEFTDGSELPADLIVYATGFSSMSDWVAQLISPETAHEIGPCWGIGSNTKKDPGPWEGELRNMWKPTKQQALWFHGGNLAQSRFYSLILALQIKARLESLKTPVYGSIVDEVD